jgi:hypothetical protein
VRNKPWGFWWLDLALIVVVAVVVALAIAVLIGPPITSCFCGPVRFNIPTPTQGTSVSTP